MSRSESRLSVRALERLDAICMKFESQCQAGMRPKIESFLWEAKSDDDSKLRSVALRELLLLEWDYLGHGNPLPNRSECLERFPDDRATVESVFAVSEKSRGGPQTIRIDMPLPSRLGDRYVLIEKVGKGAFATVYRARDELLKRYVAVKVPHRTDQRSDHIQSFLTEAQLLAKLDHPSIVPVYDTGSLPDGRIFVVTKFIDGISLDALIENGPIEVGFTLKVVSQIATALEHAHRRGLVHRDLKPSNVLLDANNLVFVSDFGLALEIDVPSTERFVGTPAYMSPEQASGESHLVDHRSDIFSLGAILYQMLTGKRAFQGTDSRSLLEQLKRCQPIPPRQLDPAIPAALERICLRALSRQIMMRYGVAADIASEIKQYQEHAAEEVSDSNVADLRVVPKGLNSFNSNESEGFLQLLSGPRDRTGLPESLRYWKQRIESRDAESSFRIGLLSGPSGSGKSSLVKAGLIPRLDSAVQCVFLEADSLTTEDRLLTKCQTVLKDSSHERNLVQSTSLLRRNSDGKKYLLVIDQFEQWLSNPNNDGRLLDALRQCDGENLQCLLIVRDDFGMATTRFMQQLESRIEQHRNFDSVELFSREHAARVLEYFARGLGKWPGNNELHEEQKQFIRVAVSRLAVDQRVVAVKLSLFAQLMQERPWDLNTLESFGTLTDIAVAFLDQKLGDATSHPVVKRHRTRISLMLESLLPSNQGMLKGHSLPASVLASRVGLENEPFQFSELLNFLDNQTRLIAKVDEFTEEEPFSRINKDATEPTEVAYRLTHDFLVPSIRQWLAAQQQLTLRGRVSVKFRRATNVFQNEPDRRRMPPLLQWIQFRWMMPRSKWNVSQQNMMRAASNFHWKRIAMAVTLLVAIVLTGRHFAGKYRAARIVDQLKTTKPSSLKQVIEQLSPVEQWAAPELARSIDETPDRTSRSRLNLLLGALAFDSSAAEEAVTCMTNLESGDFGRVCELLRTPLYRNQNETLTLSALQLADDPRRSPQVRVKAICLLSQLAPTHPYFLGDQNETVALLMRQSNFDIPRFVDLLQPVSDHLYPAIKEYFDDASSAASQRIAGEILAGLNRDDATTIYELLKVANEDQLKILLKYLEPHEETLAPKLRNELSTLQRSIPVSNLELPIDVQRDFGIHFGQDKNWILATKVPQEEFAELNRWFEKAGLACATRRDYQREARSHVAALWNTRFESPMPPIQTDDSKHSGVTLRVAENYPDKSHRQVELYFDKLVAETQNARRVLPLVSWISHIRYGKFQPLGVFKQPNKKMFLPQLPLDQLRDFTIEAQVRNWSGPILSQGRLQSSENSLWFEFGGDRKEISFGWTSQKGQQKYSGKVGLETDRDLNHVVLVFAQGRQRCFVDGELVADLAAKAPGPATNYRSLWLGQLSQGTTTRYGAGDLISLRVSKTARYQDDFVPPNRLDKDSDTLVCLNVKQEFQSSTKGKQARLQTIVATGLDIDHLSSTAFSFSQESLEPMAFKKVAATSKSPEGGRWDIVWQRSFKPTISEREYDRMTNLSIALWELGDPNAVVRGLTTSSNDILRTRLLLGLADAGTRPKKLIEELRMTHPASVRQALVLALGNFDNRALPYNSRENSLQLFVEIYKTDSDCGVRAAVAQLLDRWGHSEERKKIDLEFATGLLVPPATANWTYAKHGELMAIVETPQNDRGTAEQTASRFAIATSETTMQRFSQFDTQDVHGFRKKSLAADMPRNQVTWFQAASYCNWLSKRGRDPAKRMVFSCQ